MITLVRRCHHLFKKIEQVGLIVRIITWKLGHYGEDQNPFSENNEEFIIY